MVFQPRTLISPQLGSRRLTLHFNLTLLPHLFLLSFLDHLFPPLSYLLPIRSRLSSRSSRFTLSPSLLPLRSAAHLGAALTRHLPPAAACPCALHCMPVPSAISCSGVLSPFLPLAYAQVLVCPWGVCPSQAPPRLYVPALPPQVLLRILALSGPWYRFQVDFRNNTRGQGASTPWQPHVLILDTPATFPCRSRSGYPDPPPSFPPLHPPFAAVIPSLLVE